MWKNIIKGILYFISFLIALFFAIKRYNNLQLLSKSEYRTNILYRNEYSGHGAYYNYYFITSKNEIINITNNVNTKKTLFNEHKKYRGKKVVYLVEQPKIYEIYPVKNIKKNVMLTFGKFFGICIVLTIFISYGLDNPR